MKKEIIFDESLHKGNLGVNSNLKRKNHKVLIDVWINIKLFKRLTFGGSSKIK